MSHDPSGISNKKKIGLNHTNNSFYFKICVLSSKSERSHISMGSFIQKCSEIYLRG